MATRRSLLAIILSAMTSAGKEFMTEQERNQRIVDEYQAAFNKGDMSAASAHFSDPTNNHGRIVPRALLLMILEDIKTRFPDAELRTENIVAVTDQVIVRNQYSGTHLGVGRLPVDGGLLVGVPPTGKKFAVDHIHWFKLKDGLIVEHRATRDDVGMMVQLGLIIPPPAAPPAS